MSGGRPSKYREEYLDSAVKILSAGATLQELAESIGVSRPTLYSWAAKHPEFQYALKKGAATADNRVELALYEKAITGDVTACIFWLKNRKPDEWRDVRGVDHSGAVRHTHAAEDLSDEELVRIARGSRRNPSETQKGEGEPTKVH